MSDAGHKSDPSGSASKFSGRVLHVLRLPMGGLFRHVSDLVKGQEEAGISTAIVCAEPVDDTIFSRRLSELENICSLGVHLMPMSRLPGVSDLMNIRETGRIADRLDVNIIHGHGAKGGLLARLAPVRQRAMRIYTPHGGSLHYSATSPQGLIYLMAERLMKARTDGVIFESLFSAQTYTRKVGAVTASHAVIHNGLREDEFMPVNRASGVADFLFIGELRWLKGVSTLIEAASMMHIPVHIRIVGAGPDRNEFEVLAKAVPAHIRIEFMGAMPAREAFSLGRIVLMPSWHESLPYVVLEALAAGLPIIATNVGGVPEIFGSDSDELVEPENATTLSVAMMKALDEPEKLKALSERLRERVKAEFSAANMVAGVNAFYATLLKPSLCEEGEEGSASPSVRNAARAGR